MEGWEDVNCCIYNRIYIVVRGKYGGFVKYIVVTIY